MSTLACSPGTCAHISDKSPPLMLITCTYVCMYLYRECLDAIILRVKIIPGYFKTFCCILNTRSCYESIVKSLVKCYSVYRNEEQIKKYIDIEKVLSHFKDSLARNKFLEFLAKITSTSLKNRNKCLINILQEENPDFIDKFIKYLALKDCPDHSELYYHIQKSENEILCIPSGVNYLPGIKRYQDHLKKIYVDEVKVEVHDTFNNDIHQFVNLSLIKPQDETSNNEYLKALQDPYHLLFNHKQYTKNTATPLKSLSEIFDTSESVSQVILIQGSPGCGKTTLANKICIEWAKGHLVQHYILVILLNLRDVTISDIESIDEMVECTMGDKFVSEVVDDINCIEGKNILLLLEGWDELPEDKQINKSFFANTIAGKVLKKGNILITSRPSSIGSIQKKFITRHIAILGFSEDQMEQYVDQCFVDSSHGPKDTTKYRFMAQLNSNPMLKSLAYVPVNLSILVYVFKQYESKLPSTLTELYQQYVLLKLSLYNQRQSDEDVRYTKLDCLPNYISEGLNKLCELAYGGIKNQKLYFTQEDIQKLYQHVPLDYDGMGLLQVGNYMLRRGSDKTYNFIHKTVQEFLAAWHMTKIPDEKSNLLKYFQIEHFEMVFVFYAGLTKFKHFDFAEILPLINENKHVSLENLLTKALYSIGPTMLKKNCEVWNLFETKINVIRDLAYRNEHRMSVMIVCCAEAKNPAVCRAFSNSGLFHRDICYIHFSESAVNSQLLSSLSYCIAYSGKKWYVHWESILSEQDVLSLQKYLIGVNDITGKLVAFDSGINSSNAMHLFVERFLQPHSTICRLDLSSSKFDDDCITILSEALRLNGSLILLYLIDCNISSKGILTIAEMLRYNNTLQYIDLQDNTFAIKALIQVLQIIKCNTSLIMMNVDDTLFYNKQTKEQLVLFNRNRKNPLMLQPFQAFRFGDTLLKFGFIW